MRSTSAALVPLLLLSTPSTAWAHHAVSVLGVGRVEPVSMVELTLELGEFDYDGDRGRYQTLAAYFEYRLFDLLALSIRLPMVHVGRPDASELGLGDPELAAKVRILSTDDGELILSGGLGLGFPLGDEERGLGSGHFELLPFLSASVAVFDWLALIAVVNGSFSLGSPGAAQASSSSALVASHLRFIPPSPRLEEAPPEPLHHELGAQLSVVYLAEPAYVLGGAGVEAPLETGASVGASVHLEVGVLLADHFRVTARGELPFAGHLFERRANLGIGWMF